MKNLLYRGERNVAISAMALAVALSLTACGDDVTEVTQVNENSVISVLEAGQELSKQECSKGNAGEILFVTDSAMVFMCNGEKWVSLKGAQGETGAKGEKGADGVGKDGADGNDGTSCTAKPVNNLAGLEGIEVTCGKEVVGTIWNGEDLIATSGTMGSFVDSRDGQIYKTVVIGSQTWMAENLKYNLKVLPEGKTEETDSVQFSWCAGGDGDEGDCNQYGRLYTWAGAIDSVALANDSDNPQICGNGKKCTLPMVVQGVCPSGWHLPSFAEWEVLADAVGGKDVAGKILKAASGWEDRTDGSSGNGTDSYGFSVLPSGYGFSDGYSYNVGYDAGFWTTSQDETKTEYSYCIFISRSYDEFNPINNIRAQKYTGFVVRCLKDK